MEFLLNPKLKQQIYDNIRGVVVKEREGIHLSDTIYCSRKFYWRKRGLAPKPTNQQCLLYATGFAFQAWLFPAEIEQPIFVDGVWCSPDVSSGIEVKSTRQSSKHFMPEEMEHWNRQVLGYCKALNKLEYDLAVMFVCGDYGSAHWECSRCGSKEYNDKREESIKCPACGEEMFWVARGAPFPYLDCWHITATQEEVDSNWEWVKAKAAKLTACLNSNEPPEPDNASWEVDWCECVNLCQDTICWRKKQLGGQK